MFWRVYVHYALTGFFKYNFVGDKHELMTLIGCLVSTSIEQCSVRYQQVQDIDTSLKFIYSSITKAGKIIIKERPVKTIDIHRF